MHHDASKPFYFYVTKPVPCPYIEGLVEQKIFTELHFHNATALNELLSQQGFRRSQNIIYRPACENCSKCISVRIPVAKFNFSQSMRRILRRNAHLERRILSPRATYEHYGLFNRYLKARHAQSDMVAMDYGEYRAMVEDSPISTAIIEYRDPQSENITPELVCLTDELRNGFSLVYSFFDPACQKNSLGSYAILDHIRLAEKNAGHYIYLGYWIKGAPHMKYKERFQPLEGYWGDKWVALENLIDK